MLLGLIYYVVIVTFFTLKLVSGSGAVICQCISIFCDFYIYTDPLHTCM